MPLPLTSTSLLSQSTASSRTSLTALSTYSAPSSLPDTFGVGPLFMWDSASSRRINSEVSSTLGARSTAGNTRTAATSLSVVSELIRNPPPLSMTTSSWIMEKLESLSATRSSVAPSQSASNAAKNTNHCGRASTPEHMLGDNKDEARLKDGDYDVDDGSVPESFDNELHLRQGNKRSIYVDDEAVVSKRKRTQSKGRYKKAYFPKQTANSGSDEEPPAKRRKSKPKSSPVKKSGKGKRVINDSSDDQASRGPERWTGTSQGAIQFAPKPHDFDSNSAPLWTYSTAGISRQSPNHRAVGDIHFAPNLGEGPPFHYWVQVGTVEGGCWELYNPGRQHPLYAGYILTGRKGKHAPSWALKDD